VTRFFSGGVTALSCRYFFSCQTRIILITIQGDLIMNTRKTKKPYAQVVGYWQNTPENETVNTICLGKWHGESDDSVMFYTEGAPLMAGDALPIHPEPYIIKTILNVTIS
jgi:hypothetical protein